MAIFTGRLGDVLAAPGGLVLGYGGDPDLTFQSLNLFLKGAEIPSKNASLPLLTVGVNQGVAKPLPLFISGKNLTKSLNLYIFCDQSSSQRNMNLFVEGGYKNKSGSVDLFITNNATEIVSNSLPLTIEAPVFGKGLNLLVWRTPEEYSTLPLTITGFAQQATGSCVLYLAGPVGIEGSLDMVTKGTGTLGQSVDLITEGY